MAIAETALPGRLLSIQLWGVTIRWGKAKMWWEREEGKARITRRRQRQKNKNEFRSPFLVVSFSLCDLIVMEHTALPWKMPFQLSLADETTTVDITSRDFLAEHYLIITEKIKKDGKIRTSWRWCNPARDKDHHHKNR
jgi:hypothetical protein